MYRLLIISCSIILINAGLVRVPKIYNALISSDENLSPSHAIPVIEPVLRTTALGVAFPPPVFIHSVLDETPKSPEKGDEVKNEETDNKSNPTENKNQDAVINHNNTPLLTYHSSLYPLRIDPYFPYSYSPELLFPALPYYQQPIIVDLKHFNNKDNKKTNEPPKLATNFKKNPDIPDVPPPPLPIKHAQREA